MKRPSPRKGRPYAILAGLAAAAVVALPFVLTATGCGRQSEGQRCDRNVSANRSDPTTGNDDCDTSAGLVCTSKDVLGSNSDICCPLSGASENPNCQRGSGEGTGGAAPTTAVTSAAATTSSGASTSGTASSSASSSSSGASSGSSSSSGSGSSSSTGP